MIPKLGYATIFMQGLNHKLVRLANFCDHGLIACVAVTMCIIIAKNCGMRGASETQESLHMWSDGKEKGA